MEGSEKAAYSHCWSGWVGTPWREGASPLAFAEPARNSERWERWAAPQRAPQRELPWAWASRNARNRCRSGPWSAGITWPAAAGSKAVCSAANYQPSSSQPSVRWAGRWQLSSQPVCCSRCAAQQGVKGSALRGGWPRWVWHSGGGTQRPGQGSQAHSPRPLHAPLGWLITTGESNELMRSLVICIARMGEA